MDFLADFDKKKDVEEKGNQGLFKHCLGLVAPECNLGKVEVGGGKVFEEAVMV